MREDQSRLRYWRPDELDSISTELEWEKRRTELKDNLKRYLGERPFDPPPLDVEFGAERDCHAYIRQKITYTITPHERGSAFLLVPKQGVPPFPAVLTLHPKSIYAKKESVGLQGKNSLAFGLELVIRGFVVIAPDGLEAGDRSTFPDQPYDTTAFYQRYPEWSAWGMAIWENQCALDLLGSMPHLVDASRIGAIGHSHGGYNTIVTTAFDRRIRAAVSSCGFTLLRDDPTPLRWAGTSGFCHLPKLRHELEQDIIPFDFDDLLALIAPTSFLHLAAINDEVFPLGEGTLKAINAARCVYDKIYNASDRIDMFLHDKGHNCLNPGRQRAFAWLVRWLQNAPSTHEQPCESVA